jgi:hypothetical protein
LLGNIATVMPKQFNGGIAAPIGSEPEKGGCHSISVQGLRVWLEGDRNGHYSLVGTPMLLVAWIHTKSQMIGIQMTPSQVHVA